MTDGGRPQDQGRQHRRRGQPSAETRALLTRYQAALRAELEAVLTELEAVEQPGLGMTEPALKLPLHDARRDRLIDRAVKVARELGSEIDPMPAPDAQPAGAPKPCGPRRIRKADV